MEFLIKKGKHYCSNWYFGIHFGAISLKQKIRFDKSCLYTPDRENDWNKGCGFTYSLFNDDNSVRWAWRPSEVFLDRIEIGIYVHEEGEIIRPFNTEIVSIDTEYVFHLINSVLFRYKKLYIKDTSTNSEVFIVEDKFLKPKIGYLNRPYFGGDNSAPHDIKINITNIK